MTYRLHIDIPLGDDEERAIYKSKLLIQEILGTHNDTIMHLNEKYDVNLMNYRLGHDDDRQKSNYLDKNENGHCSNKKTKISI
tara:strand:- start:566 stop:814 length:249 start_codon:yes stop_codon:yes gene_type:complete